MSVQIYDLQTVQLGVESAAGTLVAATHVVDFESAKFTIKPSIIRTHQSGSLATNHHTDIGLLDYEVEIVTLGTYDRIACMLPFFLSGATTTGTGGSADKTWTFTPSNTTDNLKTASIEIAGVDTWPTEYKLAGCKGKSFEIDINSDAPWKITWTFTGQKLTTATHTGSLTAASSLVGIRGFTTKVYIDDTTVHTTQPGTLLTAKLKVDLATSPRHYLGSTTGEAGAVIQTGRRKVTLDLVGEWQASAEYTAWLAGTKRKISLDSVGASLGGSNYEARFDVYCDWDTWTLGNSGGAFTQEMSGIGIYDASATADILATIVNSIAAIP